MIVSMILSVNLIICYMCRCILMELDFICGLSVVRQIVIISSNFYGLSETSLYMFYKLTIMCRLRKLFRVW